MECAYADHLRNVALVSISYELRARSKRRSSISVGEQRARDTQSLVILRKKTDEDRKALRDHMANCRRCQDAEQEGAPRLGSEDLAASC
jgi:hypothetical protein